MQIAEHNYLVNAEYQVIETCKNLNPYPSNFLHKSTQIGRLERTQEG